MAQQVGDLWPYASGTASLGAEQVNGPQGGFTSEIRPFNHVHMNSGVWHDPLYGQSGVIRFSQRINGFEYSVNGGLTFAPLIDLQGAYNYGQFIGQIHRPAPSYILSNSLLSQHDPLVVGQIDPGAGNSAGYDQLSALRDASIVASGFTLTPDLVNTFAYTAILPGTIAMQGSGTATQARSQLIIACSDLLNAIIATASGTMIWNADGGMIINQNGNSDILIQNIGNSKGDGGQIKIEAFNGSGKLQYRLGGIGGHEAWHWQPSYALAGGPNNDGFFPIPHSGQILGMIFANASAGSTLQAAYEANNNVFTSAAQGGPVNIAGVDTPALGLYAAEIGPPHFLISGVMQLPSAASRGHYWLQGHTAGWGAQLQGATSPTTAAAASARSLGIETFFQNTGSGFVNISTGSGIAQFFNVSASQAIDDVGLNLPIATATTPDTWYGVSSASGIQPWVAGKYRITYTAVLEKTQGNLGQVGKTELRYYDKNGNQFRLLGSTSAAYLRDNNALNLNSANGQWMGDLAEGVSIFLFANATEAPPADNSFRARARACNVIIEWIGPLSAGKSTHQKVT